MLNYSQKISGDGFGRICQKWPDAGPTVAGAEILYIVIGFWFALLRPIPYAPADVTRKYVGGEYRQ